MKNAKVLFVSGIPNDKLVEVVSVENNFTKYIFSGSVNIYSNLEDEKIEKKYLRLDLLKKQKTDFDDIDIIFNQISDADTHSKVLMKLLILIKNKKIPIINHPRYILETARNSIYARLKNVEKVKVPKTVKLVPILPEDIDKAIKKHGFSFPVILRKTGTHGGKSVKLLKSFEDTKKLYDIALDGSAFYLIQFFDYKEEGVYKKLRLVVVDGKAYLRHVIFSDNWIIHSRSRDFMNKYPEYQEKEIKIIESFEEDLEKKLKKTINTIYKKIKLDYFGIDCTLDKDNNIFIFELNANMNVLINTGSNPIFVKQIDKIKVAIKNMIFKKLGV